MRVRPYGREDVPVLTGSQSAELDRRAIEEVGVPQAVLMENAGRSAAAVLAALFPRGPVVALVGKGNNGGDALVLCRSLAEWGRPVRAVVVGDRPVAGVGEPLLHGWPVERTDAGSLDDDDWDRILSGAGVVVDGLLGTGIRGAPREPAAHGIRRSNAAAEAGVPVLALDIPSGVDADTGAVEGDAVWATATVSFGWPKLGAVLHPGRGRVGRLIAVDIGFPPPRRGGYGARLVTPAWAAARRPRRSPDTHKNEVGALLVVAGRKGMAGAAVLAARAALRAGAGLVRVASPPDNRAILQEAVPEAIHLDGSDPAAVRAGVQASAAVVVGPGLGTDDDAEARLAAVLDARSGAGNPPRALLLDADGLNLLAEGRPRSLEEAVARDPVLLTPHPGEMGRLTGTGAGEVQADRPGAARRLSRELGCAVLLKGSPSLVADGDDLLVDTVGTSDLATGGMGDVLSGVVGALMARGLGPADAAGVGLLTSGRAAARAGLGPGLIPTDVTEHLPAAAAEEGHGWTELPLPFVLFDQDPAR